MKEIVCAIIVILILAVIVLFSFAVYLAEIEKMNEYNKDHEKNNH